MDSVASHQQYQLPYTLVSDQGGAVRRRCGATTLGILPGRVTFVIDEQGTVQHVFSSALNADKHIQEALGVLRGSTMA